METQQDLLTDLEHESIWYQDATTLRRAINCVIDLILIYMLVAAIEVILLPELMQNAIGHQVLNYTLLFVYYSLMETVTNGKTIGKMVTGTKAIRVDSAEFTGKDAVLRSLCRLVPFDSLCALFGYTLHDKWTKTRVVKLPS
jgi:uncharacterized RDD family membrane protein YckC